MRARPAGTRTNEQRRLPLRVRLTDPPFLHVALRTCAERTLLATLVVSLCAPVATIPRLRGRLACPRRREVWNTQSFTRHREVSWESTVPSPRWLPRAVCAPLPKPRVTLSLRNGRRSCFRSTAPLPQSSNVAGQCSTPSSMQRARRNPQKNPEKNPENNPKNNPEKNPKGPSPKTEPPRTHRKRSRKRGAAHARRQSARMATPAAIGACTRACSLGAGRRSPRPPQRREGALLSN